MQHRKAAPNMEDRRLQLPSLKDAAAELLGHIKPRAPPEADLDGLSGLGSTDEAEGKEKDQGVTRAAMRRGGADEG